MARDGITKNLEEQINWVTSEILLPIEEDKDLVKAKFPNASGDQVTLKV